MHLNLLLGYPHLKISDIQLTTSAIHLFLAYSSTCATCTSCGNICKRIHSAYIRTIQDLPVGNKKTLLHLSVRRFFCKNKSCPRKIFSEQCADIVLRYKRRSIKANDLLSKMALEVSACKGSLLSEYITLKVSPSTCLRLVRSLDIPCITEVKHLGVDDWALRKGISYGTALVDMDTGKIIDLLKGRDGGELSKWLTTQKRIESVNRDRSGSYSSAINNTHPKAVQIADRFHLVKNLGEHVDSTIHSNSNMINDIIKNRPTLVDDRYLKRKQQFDRIKELHASGHSQTQIAALVELSRYTVWKCLQVDEPVRKERRTNLFDPYRNVIEEELARGTALNEVFNLLRKKGYRGARSNFYVNFSSLNKLDTFRKPLTLRKIAIYLFSEDFRNVKCPIEKAQMELLCTEIKWFSPLNKLCVKFKEILKGGNEALLQQWMADMRELKLKRMDRFIGGIMKDYKAVLNAVLLPLSSGVVEGNINRLKSIKRQMYGRASLELLKRKVILAKSG